MDAATAFSATQIMPFREMIRSKKAFKHISVNAHGPSQHISSDLKFLNNFAAEVNSFRISLTPASAHRHNELVVVQRKNSVIRLVVQRLLHKELHAEKAHNVTVSKIEILSRLTFLTSSLYGSKVFSSFELACEYILAFMILSKA